MTAAGKRSSILWSRRARRDLCEIGDFIARDKPAAAASWVNRIVEAVERVAVFPSSGRVVPEMGRDDVREVVLRAYRIVKSIQRDNLTVLTVFDGHRHLPDETIEDQLND